MQLTDVRESHYDCPIGVIKNIDVQNLSEILVDQGFEIFRTYFYDVFFQVCETCLYQLIPQKYINNEDENVFFSELLPGMRKDTVDAIHEYYSNLCEDRNPYPLITAQIELELKHCHEQIVTLVDKRYP